MSEEPPPPNRPHRYPFAFLEDLSVVCPGVEAIGAAVVSRNAFWCAAPGTTALPAPLLVELCAQAAGGAGDGGAAYLAEIRDFHFHQPARAGDVLLVRASLERQWGTLRRFQCAVTRDGAAVADGVVTLACAAAGASS